MVRHVETTLARSMFNCDETAAYSATGLAFRDRLIKDWNKTQQRQTFQDTKRVYYLSLEFLMGRALDNAMLNVGLKDAAKGEIAPWHQHPLPPCQGGHADAGSQAALPTSASESRTSSARSTTPPSATAAWGAWPLASSTAWPLSTTPPGATAFATDTASSSRRSSTDTRSRSPTIGWTLTLGSFPATT